MIITLTACLVGGPYAEHDWEVDIEIDESAPLDDLHQAILTAVRFLDDAHLYTFFTAVRPYGRNKRFLVDVEEDVVDMPIKDAISPAGQTQSVLSLRLGRRVGFQDSQKPKNPSKRI